MNPFTPEWFLSLGLFILPAYIANSSALYFDPGRTGGKSTPIDFGIKFLDGKSLFGKKGIEGMVAAILAGTLTGMVIGFLDLTPLGFTFDEWVVISFFLSIGTHVGDKLGSFVKRRLDLGSGAEFPYFDQLGFIIFALAFATIADGRVAIFMGPIGYATLLVGSYFVHRFFNWFAFQIGLKDVPW